MNSHRIATGGALASRQFRAGQPCRFTRIDRDVVTYHLVDSPEVARCLPVRAWRLALPASRVVVAAALRQLREDMRAERRELEAAHG